MSDLVAVRGDTQEYLITLTDSSDEPLSLDGVDVRFTAKRHYADAEPFMSKSIDDGVTVTDPSSGQVVVRIEAGDTDGAPDHEARYFYDVELTFASGDIITPLRGYLTVVPDVTRPTT